MADIDPSKATARRLKAYERQVTAWLARNSSPTEGKGFIRCEPFPLPPDGYADLMGHAVRVVRAGGHHG